MNLVGKIFTVFIFVMAVTFAAFASAFYLTHKDWRAAAIEKDKELKVATSEKEKAQQKNEALNQQLKDEKDRQVLDVSKLEVENAELGKERTKNEKIIADKQQELRDTLGAMTKIHEQLTQLRTRVATLGEEIKTTVTDRDAKLKELLRLKDQLNLAVDELMRLQVRADVLRQDLLKAQSALQAAGG